MFLLLIALVILAALVIVLVDDFERPGGKRRTCRSFETLEKRFAPAIYTWDGGGTDNFWNTKENWTDDSVPGQHQVPGPSDSAVLDGTSGKTAVVVGQADVGDVSLSPLYTGALDVQGTLSVHQGIVQSGATIQGAGLLDILNNARLDDLG